MKAVQSELQIKQFKYYFTAPKPKSKTWFGTEINECWEHDFCQKTSLAQIIWKGQRDQQQQ